MAAADLLFAMCLRHRGVHVENYGFLVPGGQPWGADELAQEFVVNFHQAYDALLSGSGGDPLVRSPYWDAQPPPLHGCLLVAHPVESPGHLGRVHAAVLAARRREVSPLGRPRSCLPAPLALARQAEVRIRAPGGSTKQFWSSGLLAGLDRCLRRRPSPRCEWRALSGQCLGLSLYEPGRTAADCASACCSSGDACEVFQFNIEEGCWLGSRLGCPEQGAAEPGRWEGAVKSGA
ncbi:unnamed protein product [Prorocentrum cordatum]|uniref:Apple domain-containing protein n=1 Tax=Prorocentrum cordatum TaxID=2364126 RepID=A0ABN9X474_9DINO|nr:unnamed protein product [Polarella glacialis]